MADPNKKSDQDRTGLFSEQGYLAAPPLGDPHAKHDAYRPEPGFFLPVPRGVQGRQMYSGPDTSSHAAMNSAMTGYFGRGAGGGGFQRIYEGEALNDPVKRRLQQRLEHKKRNLGKGYWLDSGPGKRPEGTGGQQGTFSGPISALGTGLELNHPATTRGARQLATLLPRNFYSSPAKKGSGYGYADVTINKFPAASGDEPYDRVKELLRKQRLADEAAVGGRTAFRNATYPRDLFDPNVFKGAEPHGHLPPLKSSSSEPPASLAGRPHFRVRTSDESAPINSFPAYQASPYRDQPLMGSGLGHKNVMNSSGKLYVPNSFEKSTRTRSIIEHNVMKSINRNNFLRVDRVLTL